MKSLLGGLGAAYLGLLTKGPIKKHFKSGMYKAQKTDFTLALSATILFLIFGTWHLTALLAAARIDN